MGKIFEITEEQLDTLIQCRSMLSINSEEIEELCNSKKDNIVYGFELGKIYSSLRDSFFNIDKFIDLIKNQEAIDVGSEIDLKDSKIEQLQEELGFIRKYLDNLNAPRSTVNGDNLGITARINQLLRTVKNSD